MALGLGRRGLRAFMDDLWAEYLGTLNERLAGYFRAIRPRYRTAILSNSFVGAREREQATYGFEDMCDVVVYSHEEGLEKPDRRFYTDLNAALGTRPERMTPSAPAKSPRYGATGRRLIVRRIQRWSANALAGCRLAPEVGRQTGAGRSLAIAPLWLPRSRESPNTGHRSPACSLSPRRLRRRHAEARLDVLNSAGALRQSLHRTSPSR
jgi:hypothetical protein